jgi:hypothetical protein
MARPADTSADARRIQLAIFRRMTGPERVAMAFEMSEAARALTESGIRHRHPDWSDEQVLDALLAQLLGRRLASEVRRSRLVPA